MISSAVLTTFLAAMAPVSELRGAIPLGVSLGLSPVVATALAVVGNALPVFPLLFFLTYGSAFAMKKSPLIAKVLTWVFERTRKKHGDRFERFGVLALLLFVAVPLPLTGAWTGAVIAYLVGMPPSKAGFAILGGIAIAGMLVLGLTVGFIQVF